MITILGGTFIEGDYLRNAFRWKQSIGPWEERSGHVDDIWGYWTDDAMGFYEFLQVNASFKYLNYDYDNFLLLILLLVQTYF